LSTEPQFSGCFSRFCQLSTCRHDLTRIGTTAQSNGVNLAGWFVDETLPSCRLPDRPLILVVNCVDADDMPPRRKKPDATAPMEPVATGPLRPFVGGTLRRELPKINRNSCKLVRVHFNRDEFQSLALYAIAHDLTLADAIRRLAVLGVPALQIATVEQPQVDEAPRPLAPPLVPAVTLEQLREGIAANAA